MLEMAAPIQSPAKCKVRSVVRFLKEKVERPVEMHKQTVAVYGNVMNFHLFLYLKKHLAGKKFDDDDDEVARRSHDVVQSAGGRLL